MLTAEEHTAAAIRQQRAIGCTCDPEITLRHIGPIKDIRIGHQPDCAMHGRWGPLHHSLCSHTAQHLAAPVR